MYESILFPTDGSDQANAAIEHGLDRVAGPDTLVHVLYVAEPFHMLPLDASGIKSLTSLEQTELDLQEAAEEAIEEFVARVRDQRGKDMQIEHAIRRGAPHKEIIAYADENDIQLIVLGTSGRTDLASYALGSVTERILRTTEIPVLVV